MFASFSQMFANEEVFPSLPGCKWGARARIIHSFLPPAPDLHGRELEAHAWRRHDAAREHRAERHVRADPLHRHARPVPQPRWARIFFFRGAG